MALNNLSNSLDTRIKAMVGEDWSEFVLMIRSVKVSDTGQYECQVSGRNHTTSSKLINLNVIGQSQSRLLSLPLSDCLELYRIEAPPSVLMD